MAKRRKNPQRDQGGRMEKPEGPLVVGERIRELTKAKGWTQQELAWHTGLSINTVNRVITETRGVSLSALIQFVFAFGVSADYLLGLTDDKKPPPPPGSRST